MMKIYRILVFSIAQLAFASPAIASGKIDILLVFADDLGLSSTQKQSRALTYQTVLSDVYENQLNGSETVVVQPFTSQNISYNGTGMNQVLRVNLRDSQDFRCSLLAQGHHKNDFPAKLVLRDPVLNSQS